MTFSPMFSVVIPTRNRVGTLQRALRSVSAQTVDDYETVIVDDGSADATPAFLESVQSERRRTLRNDPGRGVSASRNRGVGAARGEFIVFLDDDDELRPGALALLQNRLRASPELDFIWGSRLIHEKDRSGARVGTRQDNWTKITQPLAGSDFLPFALEIAMNAAFTIRRSVFERLGGFDEQLMVSEDRDLFIRLARAGCSGAVVAQTVIDVDEHFKDSLSRRVGLKRGPDMDLHVMEKHRDYLEYPEHDQFLNKYLRVVFEGFLRAGDRTAAMRVLVQLRRRNALNWQVIRSYLRNAPEFLALKTLLRYDGIRRWMGRAQ